MRYFHYKKENCKTWAHPQKGFTLVETLVAITILLVAIVGPMTIAARGLQSAFFAKDQITAFFLAQEGVELVRAIRDQNALTGQDWLEDIPPGTCTNSASGCGLDAQSISTQPPLFYNCNGGSQECRLNYDPNSLADNSRRRGLYNYTNGNPSPFTRQIWIREVQGGNDKEATVTVIVSWQSGLFAATKTVMVESRIFNHYDAP